MQSDDRNATRDDKHRCATFSVLQAPSTKHPTRKVSGEVRVGLFRFATLTIWLNVRSFNAQKVMPREFVREQSSLSQSTVWLKQVRFAQRSQDVRLTAAPNLAVSSPFESRVMFGMRLRRTHGV